MAKSPFAPTLGLAKRVPTMDAEARKRIEAGRALQLQQAVSQAPQDVSAVRGAQQIAPALGAQAGEQLLQQQAQSQQLQAGLGQQAMQQQAAQAGLGLEEAAIKQREALAGKGLAQQAALTREELTLKNALTQEEIQSHQRLSQYGIQSDNQLSSMSRKQREDLAALGGDVKQKLFDATMLFERDEIGRKFTNERQILKAAVASAQNEQDLKEKLTAIEQGATKEIIMLEAAHKQLLRALERGYLDEKRELTQEQRTNLAEMQAAIERKIQRKKNSAANTRLIIGGVIAVAGAFAGPAAPAISAAGASYATSGVQ